MAAAARPLTAEALTRRAEPVRKLRRDNIALILLLSSSVAAGIGGNDQFSFLAQIPAAEHGNAEIRRSQPEIALCFDAGDLCVRLGARCFEQREGVDLHCVELQFGL